MSRKKASGRGRHKDPQARREAKKYANPIASRELILQIMQERDEPLALENIQKLLNIKGKDQQEALRRRLIAMVRDGQILKNRRDHYVLVDACDLVKGKVQAHKDGFGFVLVKDDADIFLPPKQMQGVYDGDVVLVRVAEDAHAKKARRDEPRRRYGIVARVLERAHTQLVGRYIEESGVRYVVPSERSFNAHIHLPADDMAIQEGEYVVVEVTRYPSHNKPALGRVVEVLGNISTPGLEAEMAIHNYKLPDDWPAAVYDEVEALPATVTQKDSSGRFDLRNLPFVTIDGESARDFDDAVYAEAQKRGGWVLYVAIADVSAYVMPDSALDAEAQKRGNSVYFPSCVIPMLPEALSNGLCSLLPNQDRLTMVAEIRLNAKGKVLTSDCYPAVIHSHARLTYSAVARMMEGVDSAADWWQPSFHALVDLFHVLLKQRQRRGALEFVTEETQILFNKEGKINRIVPLRRNDAHRLIEECMLLANVTVADFLQRHEMPVLYRVHPTPDLDRLQDLREFLAAFGLKLGGKDKPSVHDYNAVLSEALKREEAELIQTVLLRSLPQAVYQPDNGGHFGLAYPAYLHFTSPIRRYPDLLVHRAIKQVLQSKDKTVFENAWLQEIGEHCSHTERRADVATREATDWLKCHYMQDKVGESYTGTIVSVTGFGLFVRLQEVYVEGLVHVTSLPNDYYQFDKVHHAMRGRRSGKVFRIGDELRVKVVRVDLAEQQIDLTPEGN